MNRKEWLEKKLEKEYEKERLILEQKAEKEAKNFEKILSDAKIDKQVIENVVGFFKLLRRCHPCDDSAYLSVSVATDAFLSWRLNKETRERLDPKNIYKLL